MCYRTVSTVMHESAPYRISATLRRTDRTVKINFTESDVQTLLPGIGYEEAAAFHCIGHRPHVVYLHVFR